MAPGLLRLPPHMRLVSFSLLMLLPATALSQTLGLEITVDNEDARVFNASQCAEDVVVRYTTGAMNLTICEDLEIWLTASESCATDPASGDTVVERQASPLGDMGEFTIRVGGLPAFNAEAGQCGVQELDRTWRVCGTYRLPQTGFGCGSNETTIRETTPPTIRFDSIAPSAPNIRSVGALDNSLSVQLDSPSDDTVEVRVTATPTAGGDPVSAATAEVDGSVTIAGLANGTEYQITAIALDDAGNESAPSAAATGTPIATGGLFERYVSAGGAEQGGCSSVGMATSGFLSLVVGLWFLGRRRSWR